jgi:DNA repair photolyase
MLAPTIPGLTDHEIPQLLKAAADAGAKYAGYVMLRLPYQQKELFEDWLTRHFPDRREKVLNRIRSVRGGKLNSSEWGNRMSGDGIFAEQIEKMFNVASKRYGLNQERLNLTTDHFRRPKGQQLELF